jgi:hypothetical protein
MSNLTSGSIEYFPIIGQGRKPNKVFKQSIIGEDNAVESTAQDIIVNGTGNYIGEACRDINILNSSGCIVSSGVIGVNLFSCSGLTISAGGVIYIKNVKITEDSFSGGGGTPTSGVTYSQAYFPAAPGTATFVTSDMYTIEVFGNSSEVVFLAAATGQTRVINIKNSKTVETLEIYPDGSDTIEGSGDFLVLSSTGESVTLQSNGSNNYIII